MAYIPVDVPWARALEEEPEAELPIPPLRWRNNEGEWRLVSTSFLRRVDVSSFQGPPFIGFDLT